jgi:hypothetical protein
VHGQESMSNDAVRVGVLEQHQAVLQKLLLLQHRLAKVILRQPGCPTWHPDEEVRCLVRIPILNGLHIFVQHTHTSHLTNIYATTIQRS